MVKLNKIPILLIVCVLVITFSFGIWKLMSAIDEADTSLSLEKMCIVNIYGTEGEGFVDLTIDESYLNNFLKSNGETLVAEDVDIEISRANNLSNDDSFIINITNEGELKDLGINFDKTSISYKVSGLKVGTDFDVFADLKIYVDDGVIVLDNNDCSNFVKDNVDFFIKNGSLSYKEGDTVIVGAYVDMNAATDNGYNIKITEKEYILSEQERNQ